MLPPAGVFRVLGTAGHAEIHVLIPFLSNAGMDECARCDVAGKPGKRGGKDGMWWCHDCINKHDMKQCCVCGTFRDKDDEAATLEHGEFFCETCYVDQQSGL